MICRHGWNSSHFVDLSLGLSFHMFHYLTGDNLFAFLCFIF